MQPIPDDLMVVSEASVDACRDAASGLRSAMERIGRTNRMPDMLSQAKVEFMSLDLLLTHFGEHEMTGVSFNPDPMDNNSSLCVKMSSVALDGDSHPMSPDPSNWPGSHERARACMMRAAALLDIAADPSRRLAPARIGALHRRLKGIAACLHDSDRAEQAAKGLVIVARSADAPLRVFSDGHDVLTGEEVALWSAGHLPVLGVASKNDGSALTLRPMVVIHDGHEFDPIEAIRLMAGMRD